MDSVETTNYFAQIMKKYIQNLLLVVSVIVTTVDTVSDIILAVDYCVRIIPGGADLLGLSLFYL